MESEPEDLPVFIFFIKDEPKVQLLYDILNEVLEEPVTADTNSFWSTKGEGLSVYTRKDAILTIRVYEDCPNRIQLAAKLSQLPLKRVIKKGTISCGDVDREWFCLDTGEFYCNEGYYDQEIVKYNVEEFCTEEAEDNSELMNEIRGSCKVPLKPSQYQLGWEEGYERGYEDGLAAVKHA